jgi:hypothetical protein
VVSEQVGKYVRGGVARLSETNQKTKKAEPQKKKTLD